jgi:hypothetical protein
MICAKYGLQKKDADKLVEYFAFGGYTISKSRAMNLIAGDDSMNATELHAFIEGFFFKSIEDGE